jgi:small conductance mechanosensitive channel
VINVATGSTWAAVPASTLDDITNAIQSTQTTGWDVVVAAGVMVVAYPLARLARRYGRRVARKIPNAPKMLVLDVGRLAYWMVWMVALGTALSALGVGVGWFSIAVVAMIVLAALMAKPIIESMAAGLVLTMRPSFTIGDKINVEGLTGTVLEIGTRATQLQTSTGVRVFLPNTQLLNQTIEVYTAFDHRRASFDVLLARGSDLEAAAKTMVKAVQGADRVVDDPAPTAQATELKVNAITVAVEYWYSSEHLSDGSVTHEAIRRIDKALTAEGVQLAAPLVEIETVSAAASTTEPAANPATDSTDTTSTDTTKSTNDGDSSDTADSTGGTDDTANPATDSSDSPDTASS